jgi:branched-chain amino acid transport system substrate-binding protein
MDAAVVKAVAADNPEAIFTIVYGSDLLPFVRAGKEQGLFRDRQVVNPLAGDPEYLDTLGADTPEGWLVLGYPGEADERPAHRKFTQAYRRAFGGPPDSAALTGYIGFKAIAAGIHRAGSVDTEALIRGFRGLEFDSPIGMLRIRSGDHQATVGHWIGRLACRDGRGTMVDWKFLDGAEFLPPEPQAAALRPAAARV